jgi:DNA-binding NarL/FixJ family response regulator
MRGGGRAEALGEGFQLFWRPGDPNGDVAAVAERIRVLIADPHPATRAGVRAVLEDGGLQVCAEAADAGEAVKAALRERPDLCLLDVAMPGNGIAAAQAIISSMPDTAVVMLAGSRNDDDLFDALRVGAAGYLPKETDPERLPHALRGVLAGETALPRHLVTRVVQGLRERGRRRRLPLLGRQSVQLTSREWEVVDMLCEGMSTHQMAGRLFVSSATIRTHVAAVVKKLRVPDREAAVRMLRGR